MLHTLRFLAQVVAALAFACVWFGVPGWLVARRIPRLPVRGSLGLTLIAPLFGMALLGPPIVCIFSIVPYDRARLVAAWLTTVGVLVWLDRRQPPRPDIDPSTTTSRPSGEGLPLEGSSALVIGLIALLAGLLPCIGILPFEHDGGLYIGDAIYDHAKIAYVDAIARHGLPPINPVYSPGEPALLNYYYGWLFLASETRVVTGITGWPCDVALTWLTASSALALVGALAARVAGARRRAALAAMALVLSGPALPLFQRALAPWPRVLSILPGDPGGFTTAASQLTWVPQHVLAASALVLLAWLAASMACGPRMDRARGLAMGGLAALVFTCSVWIALAGALAAAMAAAVLWQTRRADRIDLHGPATTLALAVLLGALLSIPIVVASVAGPAAPRVAPIAVALFPVSAVPFSGAWPVVVFWLVFLPVMYGVAYPAGCLGLALRGRPDQRATGQTRSASPASDDAARRFQTMSAVLVVALLAVSLCLRSTIAANDLGWRAQIVAYLLLCIWSGTVVSALDIPFGATGGFPGRRFARGVAGTLLIAGIAVGLTTGRPSLPRWAASGSSELAARRRFLVQEAVWQHVRARTAPDDVVQANPAAFASLARWPMNLAYMLFADRRSAMADEGWSYFLSYRAAPEPRAAAAAVIRDVFSASPGRDAIQALRERLHVRAVVVDQDDPVWNSTALERSGYYQVVEEGDGYRIYLADGTAGAVR